MTLTLFMIAVEIVGIALWFTVDYCCLIIGKLRLGVLPFIAVNYIGYVILDIFH